MYHGDWMMGNMWFGWVFWLVIIAAIIWLIVRVVSNQEQRTNTYHDKTPIEILKTRYAKGEISKEEFEQMKKDIES